MEETHSPPISHPTQPAQSIVSRLQNDTAYRWRVIQSCLFALTSFTMGIVVAQQGPTFLDLQIITGTDVETASYFFTVAAFGHMVGSLISGFVHGKVNNNVLMTFLLIGVGVMTLTTPYCSHFALMLVIMFFARVFSGSLANIVNAEHMHIWGSDNQPLLQAVHFTFALGGVLTPLFTEPFLAEKETGNSTSRTEGEPTIFMNSTSQWKQENTSNITWLATNGTISMSV
ncbi:sodium-dependent glucose transporter 1-like [Physella acuta]|uniref:sodium-dependent glucose transporter 1-like n=1 Tax=Physella acuta TaxID=109671 RepID=UPI0027DCCB10|nr:sodium-dependent glucose transporter 1-like [Physella acuta]